MRGEDARQVVADTGRQEPAAHAQADEAGRGQLGDHRQADWRQAQLTDRLDHVDREQRPERDLAVTVDQLRQGVDQQAERDAVEDQAQAELARDRWVGVALAEPHPDSGDDRCEDDDGHRVHRLEPGDREGPAVQVAVDDVIGQEGERAAGLLEEAPEQDVEEEDDHHRPGLVAGDFAFTDAFDDQHRGQADEQYGQQDLQVGSAGLQQHVDDRDHDQRTDDDDGQALWAGQFADRCADALERLAADEEPDQRDQHADARGQEHDLVGWHGGSAEHFFSQQLGQDRCKECADVDAHVEDGEAGIATRVVQRVQLADHGRDVRLEHAVTDDDRGQAQLEHVLVRNRNHEQAGRHEDGADQDRALITDDAVGHVAAEDGAGIHQREVGTVGEVGTGLACRVAGIELADDVEDECPTNAIESEALPEFRHEQHPQRCWMAHDLLELWKRSPSWGSSCTAHAVPPENVMTR